MSFFERYKGKNNELFYDTDDVLIVFDDDNKTCDINYISTIKEDSIIVDGKYNVPLHDTEISTGQIGRVFFYRAPSQSVKETQRLAQLELSTVLTQITAYRPPELPTAFDWTKALLFVLVFIAFIIIAVVA